MKLIIEHGKTKREINGPYNVCGSRDDLTRLSEAIRCFLKEEAAYGWVEVTEPNPSTTNQKPVPWE